MSRRTYLSLLAYGLLMASLATPVYESLETVTDDHSWAVVLLIGGAHIGVAAAVRRLWVMVLPVGFCAVSFVASGPTALSVLIPAFLLPALVLLTGLGWGAGVLARSRATLLAAAFFVVAAMPLAWVGAKTLSPTHARRVPASVRAQLPVEWSLSDLCPKPYMSRRIARQIRHESEVLLREVRRHPDWVVSVSYPYADQPGVYTTDITVRDLAKEELKGLQEMNGAGGKQCLPEYRRRLKLAIG
jgi:hypothetical protein